MKKIAFISTVFVLLAIFISCSKEKQTLTDNTWAVESMKSYADADLEYPPYVPIILSFPQKNKYLFESRLGKSWGKVSITGNKINFKDEWAMGSFYAFQAACMDLLRLNINHYTINNNKLIFTGDNGETINFVKQ